MIPMKYYYMGIPISGVMMFFYMLEQVIDEIRSLAAGKGETKS